MGSIPRQIVIEAQGRPSPWANKPHEGAWRRSIAVSVRAQFPQAFAIDVRPRAVVVEFRMLESRRGDLDNLAKPVLDTLFRQSRKSSHPISALFECDDCYIDELVLRRVCVASPEMEGAKITIELAACEGPQTLDSHG